MCRCRFLPLSSSPRHSLHAFVAAGGLLGLSMIGCGPQASGDPGPGGVGSSGAWETLTRFPEPRTEVSVAAIGEQVFVVGGFAPPADPDGPPSMPRTVWAYDVSEDEWEATSELPESAGMHHAALVSLDGKLYLLGGFAGSGFEPTGRVDVFDPATGEWAEGAPLPTPRGAAAYTVLNGRIHVIGGNVADKDPLDPDEHNTDSPDTSVGTHEAYDPSTDTWERLAPLATARNHHAGEGVDGRIVVSSGRAGSDFRMTATEIYDPGTDTWTEGAPLPTGRSGVAAAAVDGWFYVFGGEAFGAGGGTFDEAERYLLAEDRWEELPPMPSARHGFGAAVVGGRIHTVSGGPEPGFAFGTAHERYTP